MAHASLTKTQQSTVPGILAKAGVSMAAVGGILPQSTEGAIVTIGGDGIVGGGPSGNIQRTGGVNFTNLGGALIDYVILGNGYLFISDGGAEYVRLGDVAVQSNVVGTGAVGTNNYWYFDNGGKINGAQAGTDNWLPGHFEVMGVNGGAEIFGWLQFDLSATTYFGVPGSTTPLNVVSFTYDDAASGGTATDAFAKPIGGFPIPEPSAASLLALGAAGVLARRRRKKSAAL